MILVYHAAPEAVRFLYGGQPRLRYCMLAGWYTCVCNQPRARLDRCLQSTCHAVWLVWTCRRLIDLSNDCRYTRVAR